MKLPVLILRADASAKIGTGHVTRCLALAQAWKRAGGRAIFVGAVGEGLRAWLGETCEVVPLADAVGSAEEWQVFARVLQAHPVAPVVLDGYGFDAAYQERIRGAGHRLLVIDDTVRLPRYAADLLLNQNIGAEELQYRALPETQFLLGSRYALLREEFVARRGWQRATPARARRVLVTLGGADPGNVTLTIVAALAACGLQELEARIVVGPENPHQERLAEAVARTPRLQLIRFARNMPELMAWADIAISAAGSTCWELCFMMLPMLLVVLADNQEPAAQRLSARGMAHTLGWADRLSATSVAAALAALLDDQAQREQMSAAGRALVDGGGADRVVGSLQA